MKQIFLLLTVCIILSSCANKYATIVNSKNDYLIIPKPTSLKMNKGKFLINENTKIIGSKNLINEGQYLSNLISNIANKAVVFENEGSKKGNISLQLDSSITNEEGYSLIINYEASQ